MKVQMKLLSMIATLIFLQPCPLASNNTERLEYEIVATLDMSKHELSAYAHLWIPAYAFATPNEIHLGSRSAGDDKEGKPLLKIERIISKAGNELSYTFEEPGDTIIVTLPSAVQNSGPISISVYYTISLLDDGASWKKDFEYFIFPATGVWRSLVPDCSSASEFVTSFL